MKKMIFPILRKMIILLLCLLPGLCSVSCAESSEADLVILLYMTGSDLESSGGAASGDLAEMARSLPEGGNLRIIAMLSGAREWKLDISPSETSVYEITRGGPVPVRRGPSRSMGDPDTLSDFLSFAKEAYPAKRYGLILWNHGAGPLAGVCFDEIFSDGDTMDRLSLEELSGALKNSPFTEEKLAFIGFDACLMASMEVACAMAPYGEYMIASQETEPASGWSYAFLQGLTGAEPGDEIGRRIVSAYEASLKDSLRPVTLSCLDLGRTEEVSARLGAFFSGLESSVTPETYPALTRCRTLSKALGTSTASGYDLVDLIDLIGLYKEKKIAEGSELLRALEEFIVCRFSANVDYVNGISIYYPFENKSMYESAWASAYDRMPFVPGYQSFIRKISDIYMGEALMNWKSSYQTRLAEEAGTVRVSVELTKEELENTARARMLVVEDRGNGVFQRIYADYDSLHFQDRRISAVYHGEALYAVDDSGEILAGPLTWYPAGNSLFVYGIAYYDVNPDLPFDSQKLMDAVRLVYARDGEGNLSLTDIMVLEDRDASLYLPSPVDLSACTDLCLYSAGPSSPEALDDRLLPDPIVLDPSRGAPRLAFLPVYGIGSRLAYLRLTDTQGRVFCSEPVKIPNPTLIPIAPAQTCVENERFALDLKEADMVSGYGAGIRCTFQLSNRTQNSFRVRLTETSLDGRPLSGCRWFPVLSEPGGGDELTVFISARAIRETGLSPARSLSCTWTLSMEGSSENLSVSIPLDLNTAPFARAD